MSRSSLLGLAAAGPAALATLLVLAFAVREMSGSTPLSDGPPRNVAEAAGTGQVADVVRLLRAGEDPSRFWPVRPDLISSTVTRPTALEAAVWTGSGLVELLDTGGYIRDDETRRHLACLAQDIRKQEVVSYFSRIDTASCEPGAALAQIQDRSRAR
jgi:hypothetical protein